MWSSMLTLENVEYMNQPWLSAQIPGLDFASAHEQLPPDSQHSFLRIPTLRSPNALSFCGWTQRRPVVTVSLPVAKSASCTTPPEHELDRSFHRSPYCGMRTTPTYHFPICTASQAWPLPSHPQCSANSPDRSVFSPSFAVVLATSTLVHGKLEKRAWPTEKVICGPNIPRSSCVGRRIKRAGESDQLGRVRIQDDLLHSLLLIPTIT